MNTYKEDVYSLLVRSFYLTYHLSETKKRLTNRHEDTDLYDLQYIWRFLDGLKDM